MDERIFFSSNPWRTGGFALPVGTVPRDIQANAVKLLLKGHEILTLLGLRQTGFEMWRKGRDSNPCAGLPPPSDFESAPL